MYEKLNNCPLCKSGHFRNQTIVEDHAFSKESFALVKCENCKLIFTNPRPSPEEMPKFYDPNTYISHDDKSPGLIGIVYRVVRIYALKNKLKLINSFNTKKSLLDFGTGTGEFLKVASNDGWEVTGIEPDQHARTQANLKTNNSVYEELKSLEEKSKFSIITLWHVLEHVHDLNEVIKTLKKKLRKEGHLLIAVPNHESHDRKYFEEFWAGYDVPRHLYHFNQESMNFLARKNSLSLVSKIPMKFDSYYISLLSNKYKKKLFNPLKAFLLGNKFNKMSSIDGEYSSLIYVFRK